jgi:hypothetical protein
MTGCDCAKKASINARSLTMKGKAAEERATGKGSSKLPAHVRHHLWRTYHQCRFAAQEFKAFSAALRKEAAE